jgi:hypothetical protein
MALYLVLHHPEDRRPTQWTNVWEPGSRSRICSITTPTEVATDARSRSSVFIHRCSYAGEPAAIACEARVTSVQPLDARTSLVHFDVIRRLETPPPRSADYQKNSYEDADPVPPKKPSRSPS